ncbi:amino acid permease [Trypanosoma brucei equiperdum]|uniref:Amino acid permease n=1 Tax=Trypanosoma brucei equiperdum TaxID=630700 RepID=A0A3L6KYN0_9TRYP|nr:amino acid permease [Trypanosoma brucei equiperdum]
MVVNSDGVLKDNYTDDQTSEEDPNGDNIRTNRSSDDGPRRGIMRFTEPLFSRVIPHGGTLSNTFTFASATLGGSIVALPWAFHAVGIVMGTVYLFLMTLVTAYTVTIIGFVMKKSRFSGFEQMSLVVLGRGAAYLMSVVMGASCLGAAVAYVIAVRTLLEPLLQQSPLTSNFFGTTAGVRLTTFFVWLLGMLPLVLPKQINSLRYFSAIGVVCVVYFSVAIIAHATMAGVPKRGDVSMFQGGNIAVEGFGIFIFAYLCHCVAFQTYYEMRIPSVRKLFISTTIAMIFCCVLYWFAGVFAYLEFGPEVKDSVLYMYDPISDPMMFVAYVGLVAKLCVSYAMNMLPLRNTVYFLLQWEIQQLPYWKHTAVVTVMSILVLICGIFFPKISTVFGFVGSVCGGLIGFIYPALFYMYSGDWSLATVGWFHYIMTYCVLMLGVASVVFGTAATIYAIIN